MGTGFNTISASWGGGSGPATVERVVIEWLRQMIGMLAGTEAVLRLCTFNPLTTESDIVKTIDLLAAARPR